MICRHCSRPVYSQRLPVCVECEARQMLAFIGAWAKWQRAEAVILWRSGMTECQRRTLPSGEWTSEQGGILLAVRR